MKKQFAHLLILITLVFLLIGCESSPVVAGNRGTPAFVSNPPVDKAVIFGIGGVRKADARQQIQLADTRACQDIAEQLSFLVQKMIADYSLEAGIEDSQAVLEFQKAVGRSLRDAKFVDVHLIKREPAGDGTMYSLAAIKKTDALKHTANVLNAEAVQFDAFRNADFPRELGKRLDAAQMKPAIIVK
jgi:hypothetical protein